MGEEVQAFDYHVKMDAYVLGTSQKVDFKLPEDEFHDNWNGEGSVDRYYPIRIHTNSLLQTSLSCPR